MLLFVCIHLFGFFVTFSLCITEQLSWAGLALITKPSLGSTRKTGRRGSFDFGFGWEGRWGRELSEGRGRRRLSGRRWREAAGATELGWLDDNGDSRSGKN